MARFLSDSCRAWPRLVAVGRDHVERIQLFDLCDVTCDRLRRHQVLVAGCRRYLLRIEMAAGAVALKSSDCAGVAGVRVAL